MENNKIEVEEPPRRTQELNAAQMELEVEAAEETCITEEQKKEKKNRKKRKKLAVEEVTDYEVNIEEKMKTSKLMLTDLPDHVKMKYAYVESNPYNLICVNIPPHVSVEELRSYFNTLVQTMNPYLKTPPLKNVEIANNKAYAVLTCNSRESKEILKPLTDLVYQNFKMQVRSSPFILMSRSRSPRSTSSASWINSL